MNMEMKKLACKDINPSTSCTYEATGKSAKEVVGKMMAHAKADHTEDLAGKSDSELKAMWEPMVHS
ncbi:MAG: hypothetical protein QOG91_438 [Candidatus Parcubacteria bacterium]|jgi:predicted small metal-binding protein|nr:hypothetical protein [Candidatus Parcubacteria bacterium]